MGLICPSPSSKQFFVSIGILSLHGYSRIVWIILRSSSQTSRYILPLLFPITDSLLEKNSFLLTLSFSSTSHTCLFTDEYLCSQSDILYPFTVGESVFVIGNAAYSQQVAYSSERTSQVLQREDLTPGIVLNNITISQGTLDERTLSRQYVWTWIFTVDAHLVLISIRLNKCHLNWNLLKECWDLSECVLYRMIKSFNSFE